MKNLGKRESARKPQAATAAVGGSAPASGPEEQHGTRRRVARSVLDHGPSTAAELATRLRITQAAVRRHLDALVTEGMVEPREKRVYGSRGRGRPAKVFALTDSGRDAFDQSYDELAVEALRWIAEIAGGGKTGDAAVLEFARHRASAYGERYRAALAGAEADDRTRILAEELTRDGYAATARPAPASSGEQLCQHHCPVAHVAERFPQLCEAETELFSALLGTHVQRLATIAHGDGVCTTFVPGVPGSRARDGIGGRRSARAANAPPDQSHQTTTAPRNAGRNPA